jgi:hypothetical protein
MRSQLLAKCDNCQYEVDQILSKYGVEHPRARIETSRSKYGFVDIHIMDPDFVDVELSDRIDAVWKILEELSEEVLGYLGTMRLRAPGEI